VRPNAATIADLVKGTTSRQRPSQCCRFATSLSFLKETMESRKS